MQPDLNLEPLDPELQAIVDEHNRQSENEQRAVREAVERGDVEEVQRLMRLRLERQQKNNWGEYVSAVWPYTCCYGLLVKPVFVDCGVTKSGNGHGHSWEEFLFLVLDCCGVETAVDVGAE